MIVITENFGQLIVLTTPVLASMTETISFKTDVFESKNGSEHRTPLKDNARQSFDISTQAYKTELARFFNEQWGGIRANWAIPLYHESQKIDAVTGFIVDCRTDIFSFYDGGLALIKTGESFYVAEIETVEPNGLTLKNEIDIDESEIMPIRVCFISGDISRNIGTFHANASMSFVVIDEPDLIESVPHQFLNNDIYYFFLTYTGDSIETTLTQQQNIIDDEVGIIYQDSDWLHARYSKQYTKFITNKDELHEYKQFLFRRMGQYRPFWLPLYENNIRIKNTGNITTTLQIEADAYKVLSNQRKHIAIKSDDGWTAHTITASTATTLTISPALNKQSTSVKYISYLGLHRLNADSITLNHNGANIVEASVPIIEIGV